jgi:hypothetical protein
MTVKKITWCCTYNSCKNGIFIYSLTRCLVYIFHYTLLNGHCQEVFLTHFMFSKLWVNSLAVYQLLTWDRTIGNIAQQSTLLLEVMMLMLQANIMSSNSSRKVIRWFYISVLFSVRLGLNQFARVPWMLKK